MWFGRYVVPKVPSYSNNKKTYTLTQLYKITITERNTTKQAPAKLKKQWPKSPKTQSKIAQNNPKNAKMGRGVLAAAGGSGGGPIFGVFGIVLGHF